MKRKPRTADAETVSELKRLLDTLPGEAKIFRNRIGLVIVRGNDDGIDMITIDNRETS